MQVGVELFVPHSGRHEKDTMWPCTFNLAKVILVSSKAVTEQSAPGSHALGLLTKPIGACSVRLQPAVALLAALCAGERELGRAELSAVTV